MAAIDPRKVPGPKPGRATPAPAKGSGTRPAPVPAKGSGARPAPQAAKRPPLRRSTPQEVARENELFQDAGLEPQEAQAQGKDPEAAASILARKHPQAIVRLMGAAFTKGDDKSLVAAKRVAQNLYDKGARLIDVFLRSRPRSDALLEKCARLVGEVGGPDGVERLRNLLRDPAPIVRAAAFEGLARGADADQLGKLAREVVMDKEEAPEVKMAAIEALGAARAIGASAVCAKCIHDGDQSVRKAAARALTRLGPGAIPGILEDVRARKEAALGVVVDSVRAVLSGSGGDIANAPPELMEQVRKVLTAALRDPSAHVRWGAAIALGAVGSAEDMPAMDDAVTFEKDEMAKANMECARAELKKRASASS